MLCDFFDNWTYESSYFFGLLWADGSLCKNRIKFGLKLEDEFLVRLFAKKIKYQGSFLISKPCLRKDGISSSGFIEFTINNKNLSQSLRNKGLTENKTHLDLSFPEIPKHLIWSFIRGYFDEDGSIFKTSQGYYRISIVGMPLFLEQMKSKVSETNALLNKGKIRKHQNSFVHYLEWSKKEEVLCFLSELYKLSKDLALPRKKEVSLQYIQQIKKDLLDKGIDNKNGRWRLRSVNGKHFGYFDDIETARSIRDEIYGWKDLTNDS